MAIVSKLSPDGSLATNSFDEYTMAASNYGVTFNGSNQYLLLADNAAFQFGTGDFTIEAWVYLTTVNSTQRRSYGYQATGSTVCWVGVSTTNKFSAELRGVGAVNDVQVYSTTTPLINTWYHLAFVRSGTTTYLFVNGVLETTTTGMNQNIASGGTPSIGAYNIGGALGDYWPGSISNLRVVKGTAVYTAAFTPPTSPLTNITNTALLTCQSSTIIDNSTNAFAITNVGAATILSNALTLKTVRKQYPDGTFQTLGDIDEYTLAATKNYVVFNGSSQYLTVPSNAALTIGTSSATVEFWMYPFSNSGYQRIVCSTNAGFGAGTFVIRWNNGTFLVNGITSSTLPTLNAWNHIAWVGVGGATQTFYLNGVSIGTATTYNLTEAIQYIGGYYNLNNTEYYNGYLSNVRVIKGTAIYTAAFTPPTGPLLPITNTQLLTCQSSTAVDNSINNFAITTPGSPLSTSILNLYTANFSGASQYLRVPYSAAFDFSAATWTLECWFKANAFDLVILSKDTYGTNFDFCMYVSATTIFSQTAGTAQTYSVTTGLTLTVGKWYHLAMVRSAGTLNYYLDGVKYGAGSGMGITNVSQSYVTLGCFGWNNPSGFMNGSVSNLRMVQGTALYTANFTPSRTNLTAISGTTFLTYQSPTIVDNSTNAIVITNTNGVTTAAPLFPQTLAATQSSDGIYRIAGNLNEITPVNYLIAAGGGGGGADHGGGGGGGGYLAAADYPVLFGTTYSVVVGAGGNGGSNYGSGGVGSLSSFISLSAPYGSGGGGSPGAAGSAGIAGTGGGNGGQGGYSVGMAGAAGVAGPSNSISGSSLTYCSGGGGGGWNAGGGAAGGAEAGVGNAGGALANRGGGGGGGNTNNGVGAAGGSGVVIIRYADTYPDAAATTGSPTFTNTGGYKTYKFTTSGSITF